MLKPLFLFLALSVAPMLWAQDDYDAMVFDPESSCNSGDEPLLTFLHLFSKNRDIFIDRCRAMGVAWFNPYSREWVDNDGYSPKGVDVYVDQLWDDLYRAYNKEVMFAFTPGTLVQPCDDGCVISEHRQWVHVDSNTACLSVATSGKCGFDMSDQECDYLQCRQGVSTAFFSFMRRGGEWFLLDIKYYPHEIH